MSFSIVFPAAIDEWAKSTDMNRFAKCIPIIRGSTSAAIPLTLPEKGHNPFTVTARLLLAAFLSLAVVVGCATEPGAISVGSVLEPEQLAFLTRGVCVNTKVMRKRLDQALGALGVSTNYQFIDLDTLPKNDVRVGYPTPTLLYRDADIFGMPKPTPPFLEPT